MSNNKWLSLDLRYGCSWHSSNKEKKQTEKILLAALKIEHSEPDGPFANYYKHYLCRKAYEYAKNVKRERWIETERYIKKYPTLAYLYSKYVIQGRWIQAEKYIATSADSARLYAQYVMKKPWKKAEEILFVDFNDDLSDYQPEIRQVQNLHESYYYIKNVTKKRNSKFEKLLIELSNQPRNTRFSRVPKLAYNYCRFMIKGRFEEIENLLVDSRYNKEYSELLSPNEKEEFTNKVIMNGIEHGDEKISPFEMSYDYGIKWVKDYCAQI